MHHTKKYRIEDFHACYQAVTLTMVKETLMFLLGHHISGYRVNRRRTWVCGLAGTAAGAAKIVFCRRDYSVPCEFVHGPKTPQISDH